jgi:hypothetical protein
MTATTIQTTMTVRWPSVRGDVVGERSARAVAEELIVRQEAGDEQVLDDLVGKDLVNHAAGPQGREGLRQILRTIEYALGPIRPRWFDELFDNVCLRPGRRAEPRSDDSVRSPEDSLRRRPRARTSRG